MVKKIIIVCIVAAVTLSTNSAIAGYKYAGFQYAISEFDANGGQVKLNPSYLLGRLGAKISNSFIIEGRLGLGIGSDTDRISNTDVKAEIDSIIAVYGGGHIDITKYTSIYALLGLAQVKSNISPSSFNSKDTGSSYVIGADFNLGHNAAISLEYVQYPDQPDFDVSAIAIGVRFNY